VAYHVPWFEILISSGR